MPVIESRIDVNAAAFATNRADMLARIKAFRDAEQRVRDNSERGRAKFESRGQLMPRDRLALLLDRGAPFVELSTLAGFERHDDDGKDNASGGGVITGIGFVSGLRCVVLVHDAAIKGGAITPGGLSKVLRAQDIALINKLPVVVLAESAGANLLYQSEIFVVGGKTFAKQARLSAAGIPQICVVFGSSTAGGAYLPGLSDYVVVVRGRSKIFLAGPPLLKAATGEVATAEELGGAEMHATVSGTSEYMAEDDADAVRVARDIAAKLKPTWDRDTMPAAAGKAPRHDIDELAGVVPCDYRQPYDVHEVIARLVDDSDFLDFKPDYGAPTVCGHAVLNGHAIGMIGNNGPIDPAGSVKAAQFIQLCCQSDRPIVYLQNTTGYIVGPEAEAGGIVKHGSKMIQAVANATVPQLTLMIGGSFGAGNYGMCGRGYDPRFLFSWPNSRISVMGGEQAARVMAIITEDKLKRTGKPVDRAALDKMERRIIDQFDHESTPFYATARLWDDGIIDPRDSRKVLSFALDLCREGARRQLRPSSFGVARG